MVVNYYFTNITRNENNEAIFHNHLRWLPRFDHYSDQEMIGLLKQVILRNRWNIKDRITAFSDSLTHPNFTYHSSVINRQRHKNPQWFTPRNFRREFLLGVIVTFGEWRGAVLYFRLNFLNNVTQTTLKKI